MIPINKCIIAGKHKELPDIDVAAKVFDFNNGDIYNIK
jgi:hypothetical protein